MQTRHPCNLSHTLRLRITDILDGKPFALDVIHQVGPPVPPERAVGIRELHP
jgi:hypothetical protein